jgi:hypothetical protein
MPPPLLLLLLLLLLSPPAQGISAHPDLNLVGGVNCLRAPCVEGTVDGVLPVYDDENGESGHQPVAEVAAVHEQPDVSLAMEVAASSHTAQCTTCICSTAARAVQRGQSWRKADPLCGGPQHCL